MTFLPCIGVKTLISIHDYHSRCDSFLQTSIPEITLGLKRLNSVLTRESLKSVRTELRMMLMRLVRLMIFIIPTDRISHTRIENPATDRNPIVLYTTWQSNCCVGFLWAEECLHGSRLAVVSVILFELRMIQSQEFHWCDAKPSRWKMVFCWTETTLYPPTHGTPHPLCPLKRIIEGVSYLYWFS